LNGLMTMYTSRNFYVCVMLVPHFSISDLSPFNVVGDSILNPFQERRNNEN
jgi:hypothetical protein